MNNLKSGGTLFLAYEGRMGRANLLYSYKHFSLFIWVETVLTAYSLNIDWTLLFNFSWKFGLDLDKDNSSFYLMIKVWWAVITIVIK